MTERIDAKSAVLKYYHARHTRDQEGAESRFPSSPYKADAHWERKSN
jgi:hypothetical protein